MVDDFPHEVAQVFDLVENGPFSKYGSVWIADEVPALLNLGTMRYYIAFYGSDSVTLNSSFRANGHFSIQLSYQLLLEPDGTIGRNASQDDCDELRDLAIDFFAHLPTTR